MTIAELVGLITRVARRCRRVTAPDIGEPAGNMEGSAMGQTVPEVATYLGRSKGHVHSLVRSGQLRSVKARRQYPNKLTGGYSEVEVRAIPTDSLDQ